VIDGATNYTTRCPQQVPLRLGVTQSQQDLRRERRRHVTPSTSTNDTTTVTTDSICWFRGVNPANRSTREPWRNNVTVIDGATNARPRSRRLDPLVCGGESDHEQDIRVESWQQECDGD